MTARAEGSGVESRRAVITGLGLVTALGADVETFWQRALAGETRVEPIPEAWNRYSPLRSRFWSPLGDWRRDTPLLTRIERRQLDPTAELAIQAAEEALTGAVGAGFSLEPSERRGSFAVCTGDGQRLAPERCGIFLGTGIGGLTSALDSARVVSLERPKKRLAALADRLAETDSAHPEIATEIREVLANLPIPRAFHPFSVAMAMPNAAASHLAIKLGWTGPCRTYTAACAAGTVALGRAAHAIRRGDCDLALVVGTEYLADPYGSVFRGFDAVGALARGDEAPESLHRPFDADRSGFLFSEGGAGVLVLEASEVADRRGAEPLAEVLGYGETCDAHNVMGMEPSGAQIERAIRLCLEEAGLHPGEVNHVNAHGTGTEANDPIEAAVLERVLGDRASVVPVSATKSLLGHSLGASGAIEAVSTVLTLTRGVAHPCRNLERPISDRLDFVREAREVSARVAFSQSFAFGGHNAVVALEKVGPSDQL